MGLIMEALSHRRAEVIDMGPVPGNFGRTRLSLTCPSRFVPSYTFSVHTYLKNEKKKKKKIFFLNIWNVLREYITSAMSNTDVALLYKVPDLHVKRRTKHKENRGDINDLKKPREHLS